MLSANLGYLHFQFCFAFCNCVSQQNEDWGFLLALADLYVINRPYTLATE